MNLSSNNYLLASCLDKARQLNKELANIYVKGDNKYLRDLDHAIEMLNNYQAPVPFDKNKNKNNNNNNYNNTTQQWQRVAFTQATPGLDSKTHNNITCNQCKKRGHYTNQCPKSNNTTNVNTTDNNNNNEATKRQQDDETSQPSIQEGTRHL